MRAVRGLTAAIRVLWVATLVALAAPALRAAPPVELQKAQDLYAYGDFAGAIPMLEGLLASGRLTDERDLARAHRMLAVCYFQADRKPDAAREFRALLTTDPDARLDPFLFPPDVVEFSEGVRAEMAERLPEIRELKARERAARERKLI